MLANLDVGSLLVQRCKVLVRFTELLCIEFVINVEVGVEASRYGRVSLTR